LKEPLAAHEISPVIGHCPARFHVWPTGFVFCRSQWPAGFQISIVYLYRRPAQIASDRHKVPTAGHIVRHWRNIYFRCYIFITTIMISQHTICQLQLEKFHFILRRVRPLKLEICKCFYDHKGNYYVCYDHFVILIIVDI